jgi:transcriptional regulator with XRE-family HTH domain
MIGKSVRALRKRRRLTLQQVSAASGLSAAFLSQVERELTSLSVSSLAGIAKALDVSPSYFFPPPSSNGALVRGYARQPFSMDHADVVYARLGSAFEGRTLEPLMATYPPEYVSEESSHDGEEFYYVLSGQLVVVVDGEEHRLSADDSLHFDSRRPHRLTNQSDSPVRVIAVTTPTLLD